MTIKNRTKRWNRISRVKQEINSNKKKWKWIVGESPESKVTDTKEILISWAINSDNRKNVTYFTFRVIITQKQSHSFGFEIRIVWICSLVIPRVSIMGTTLSRMWVNPCPPKALSLCFVCMSWLIVTLSRKPFSNKSLILRIRSASEGMSHGAIWSKIRT